MSYIERLLKITDDLSEQIEIGRRLVVSYDKEMVKFIMSTFDKINDFEKRTNVYQKRICSTRVPMIIGCMDFDQISNFIIICG